MTSKTDFTDEEWTRLKRAPFVAGMAISLADPGGPIEAVKETAATLEDRAAADEGGRGELVTRSRARSSRRRGSARTRSAASSRTRARTPAWRSSTSSARSTASSRRRPRRRTPRRSRVVAGRRAGGRERREGGRLHGLPRRARERGRAADARLRTWQQQPHVSPPVPRPRRASGRTRSTRPGCGADGLLYRDLFAHARYETADFMAVKGKRLRAAGLRVRPRPDSRGRREI